MATNQDRPSVHMFQSPSGLCFEVEFFALRDAPKRTAAVFTCSQSLPWPVIVALDGKLRFLRSRDLGDRVHPTATARAIANELTERLENIAVDLRGMG